MEEGQQVQQVTGAVLVIGGGVAGIQSALDLADGGFKVFLVEREPSIGGRMAQLDKTFPTGDCSLCILAPKMVEVDRHPNIKLLAYSEVNNVSGSVGNFDVEIKKKPRYVDGETCTACGQCSLVCPVYVPNEFDCNLGWRKAIYAPFPQAVPNIYTIDMDHCIKCRLCEGACGPKSVDFNQREEIREIKVGAIVIATGYDLYDAETISEYGYGIYPNVITSLEFERIMCASGPTLGHIIRPSDLKDAKKIAFVQCCGSRNVKRKEYCSVVCCVYATKEAIITKEHAPEAECHICYIDLRSYGKGFNEYVQRARSEYGVQYHRGRVCNITEDPETKDVILNLFNFESQETEEIRVDLAILSPALVPSKGTETLAKMLEIETDENGFLKEKELTSINETNRPGIFVAGFAQGPKDIPDTVAQASGAAAKVEAVLASARGTLIEEPPIYQLKEVKPDEEPRIGVMVCDCGINIAGVVNVPEVVEYTKTLPNVVVAFENKYACSSEAQNVIKEEMIKEHNLNRLVVAACTPRTHEPLFQTTCEEAGLNPYLFEFANIREHDSWVHMRQQKEATEKAKDLVRMYVSKARYLQPLVKGEIDLEQKVLVIGGGIAGMTAALDSADQGFETYLIEKQPELGGLLKDLHKIAPTDENAADIISKQIKAVQEHHNIKVFLNTEIENIEGFVGNFNIELAIGNSEKKEIRIGAIILATGAKIFEPVEMYGYGTNSNIITQLELEQRLKNNEINDLQNILMIQCVGAREKEGRTYCSRICCTAAIKNAMTLRERFPTANIYILNRDIIMPAKGLEEYYRIARENNITFIRFHEDKPPIVTSEKDIVKVNVYDTSAKAELCMDCDLLVLSTPLVSQDGAKELSKQLKVPMGQDSFFLEAHMKLRPLDFATDGIYICGIAHYPKSVSEATAQASGAASRATIILSKGVIETIGFISVIDEEKCIGCGTCVSICPYNAIETVEVFKKYEDISFKEVKSRINPALCKGCGMCRPACPVGAISAKHFTEEQIMEMLKACLS